MLSLISLWRRSRVHDFSSICQKFLLSLSFLELVKLSFQLVIFNVQAFLRSLYHDMLCQSYLEDRLWTGIVGVSEFFKISKKKESARKFQFKEGDKHKWG